MEAREAGLVRYLGVTGHRSPEVIRRCLETFGFDTVMIPVNPAERHYKSFLTSVLSVAAGAGVGVIGRTRSRPMSLTAKPNPSASRLPWDSFLTSTGKR